MGLRRKERWHGQRSSPGSEWFQPDTGHPSSVFLDGENEPLWLIAGLVRLREGLWEAWTSLLRSRAHLLAPKAVRRERTENCMSDWPVSQDCPPGSGPSLSLGNTPALLASRCSCTFTFSTRFSLFSPFGIPIMWMLVPWYWPTEPLNCFQF